jgi:hypothetical protein
MQEITEAIMSYLSVWGRSISFFNYVDSRVVYYAIAQRCSWLWAVENDFGRLTSLNARG